MLKKTIISLISFLIMSSAFAGTWIKVRGSTKEAAFFNAQQQYGKKFVQRGSCTLQQSDGYYYCDALIED